MLSRIPLQDPSRILLTVPSRIPLQDLSRILREEMKEVTYDGKEAESVALGSDPVLR